MTLFNEVRLKTNRDLLVKLLTILSEKPETTQRTLARELGVSLGMIVKYMRSCARKGFLRSRQIAPRRWVYFVTPKGFVEKSKMVSDCLRQSMLFFRNVKCQIEDLFAQCQKRKLKKIAMVGKGDIAEVAMLVSNCFDLHLELFSSDGYCREKIQLFDAVLITDSINPQATFDSLKEHVKEENLLGIPVLCIVRNRVDAKSALQAESLGLV